MVILYLDVNDFGWQKKKKMLTGGDMPEALLVPGEAFQVGQTIDGNLAEVLLGFHMLPLRLKDVLRSSTTLLIGEAGKLLYNYARLHWKNREN